MERRQALSFSMSFSMSFKQKSMSFKQKGMKTKDQIKEDAWEIRSETGQ